jgi:hypothetical protein
VDSLSLVTPGRPACISKPVAPVVADALTPMIRAARANGLNIWAWMTTKYAAWGQDRYRLFAYDFSKKTIVPAFGRDLFDDREVADLVALYQDLAAYDIDGILFRMIWSSSTTKGWARPPSACSVRRYARDVLSESPFPDGSKYLRGGYTDRFWSSPVQGGPACRGNRRSSRTRRARPDLKFAVNLV